jgi:ubiquinone/menaquinone biosynthesis C-methylase UbiE
MPTRTSREQFDHQAAHYNAQWNQWSEESLRWLLEHAQCRASDRVLDIATGTGFTALSFAPLVAEVVGLDVSEGMLAKAREQARAAGLSNVSFETGAAESIPFPDAQFDIVTCRVAPHHFLSVPAFLTEANRVLRPGGRLLIADTTVPDNAPEVDAWQNRAERLRDQSHVRNYSPSEWRTFVNAAAFNIEDLATLDESASMNLDDWLAKSGCTGESAAEVRRMFAEASEAVRRAFAIAPLDGGETGFRWIRIVLAARKPSNAL